MVPAIVAELIPMVMLVVPTLRKTFGQQCCLKKSVVPIARWTLASLKSTKSSLFIMVMAWLSMERPHAPSGLSCTDSLIILSTVVPLIRNFPDVWRGLSRKNIPTLVRKKHTLDVAKKRRRPLLALRMDQQIAEHM